MTGPEASRRCTAVTQRCTAIVLLRLAATAAAVCLMPVLAGCVEPVDQAGDAGDRNVTAGAGRWATPITTADAARGATPDADAHAADAYPAGRTSGTEGRTGANGTALSGGDDTADATTAESSGYPSTGTAETLASPDGVSGELRKWHKVTADFEGPETSETADRNPFRDYRLDVTFTHTATGRSITVPGYYAADGAAGGTGAQGGNIWRAHLTPDAEGEWTYRASFRTGPDVAVADDPAAGEPVAFDGSGGRFVVGPTDKTGRDFRGKGLLEYVGAHYLQFAETGEYFIKGGANSPENLLAYFEFDNTVDHGGFGNDLPDGLHHFEPHVADWQPDDPTWHGGKGKGIIGALNYLAGQGMNSVYFVTMNVEGDGREVYPWIDYEARDRYDVSKLDQWEAVFEHMDHIGLMMHVVTQEEENDHLLDDGQWGPERQVYYRELVARFGHHLAVTWNLGEESSNTDEQRQAFARYLRELDPYDHPITVHTFPGDRRSVYTPLLGFDAFEGPSMQISEPKDVNDETRSWYKKSANAGRPWVITADEMAGRRSVRCPTASTRSAFGCGTRAYGATSWGGGGGVEWFFGTAHPHNDLDAEDFRTRAILWGQTRHALDFYQHYLPFHEMAQCNGLINNGEGYCFGKPGEIYAIYMKRRGPTELDLGDEPGIFHVRWYNPRSGGALLMGTVSSIEGPGKADIGDPPGEHDRDWVALISRTPPASGEARLLPAVAVRWAPGW